MRRREESLDVEDEVAAIQAAAVPVSDPAGLDRLIERVAGAQVVMLGEATHGTREFYEWRHAITRALIERHGFSFVAVEGDWPACQELNAFASGARSGELRSTLAEAFRRWPTWMWANEEVAALAEWLRAWNLSRPGRERVGFHGLDVYSLFESIDAVIATLERINPILARRARVSYGCFERFGRDERRYARSLIEIPDGCRDEAARTLQELLKSRLDGPEDRGDPREPMLFDVRQNARVVAGAEDYYRTMMLGPEDSWNVRDRHMMETLELLLRRYEERLGRGARGVVWEHNTHIGDYRATDMLDLGQVNLGGLARRQLGDARVALVGFSTYRGEVIASPAWDGPIERLEVPPGRAGSWEHALHAAAERLDTPALHLPLGPAAAAGPLGTVRGHRAIGVVYDPRHERWGNYVPTSLARRYDELVFIDATRALRPLPAEFDRREIPETWPAGQ